MRTQLNILNLTKRHRGKYIALRKVEGGCLVVVSSKSYKRVSRLYKERGADSGIMFIRKPGIHCGAAKIAA